MQDHLLDIKSLRQEPWEKMLLNANLIVILAVALFLYIYYSIDPISDAEYERVLNETLQLLAERRNNS